MSFLRPYYFRSQVNKFIVLFVERAGSTYLVTLLNSHPDILSLREEFSALRLKGMGAEDQLQRARQIYTPPLIGTNKAIGFKSKLIDILDVDGFTAVLHENNCRVIQLMRRNSVKAVISTINADRLYKSSGTWNLLKEGDRMPPFEVDYGQFETMLQERLEWDRDLVSFVEKLNLPKLTLYYEDLLKDESRFLGEIFSFLGVSPKPVKGKTIKHTRDNLREVLTNFDQLRARYRSTPFEAMFDEVITNE